MLSTRQNFVIGFAFLALLAGLYAWKALQPKDCGNSTHTTLILFDVTDPLSAAAIAAAKDRAWDTIESAPDFSRVIVKPIRGLGGAQTTDPTEFSSCRPIKPTATTGFQQGIKIVERDWSGFKDWFCGDSAGQRGLACGDSRRTRKSALDSVFPPSTTSPILESIVDNARQYISPRVQSWNLIVITDWKQYGSSLDLHLKRCDIQPQIDMTKVPFLADTRSRVLDVKQDFGRPSQAISLFAVRDGMMNLEADCLQRFGEKFLNSITSESRSILPSETFRLPRS
jgi:hypothetical protein